MAAPSPPGNDFLACDLNWSSRPWNTWLGMHRLRVYRGGRFRLHSSDQAPFPGLPSGGAFRKNGRFSSFETRTAWRRPAAGPMFSAKSVMSLSYPTKFPPVCSPGLIRFRPITGCPLRDTRRDFPCRARARYTEPFAVIATAAPEQPRQLCLKPLEVLPNLATLRP